MKIASFIISYSSLFVIATVGAFGSASSPSSSLMHLRADVTPPIYKRSLQQLIPILDDFDNSRTLKAFECFDRMTSVVEEIVPNSLRDNESFLQDVKDMMITTSSMATEKDELVVRLALMRGQKCPKWHEDYVKIRLLKAYYGNGPEYALPDDNLVRLNNALNSLQGKDLAVHPSKVKKCGVNDILIIRGKKSTEEGFIPVLHRSPAASDEKQRRLLLTITIP